MERKQIKIDVLPEFRDFFRVLFWRQIKRVWPLYLILLIAAGAIIFLSIQSGTSLDLGFLIPLILLSLLAGSIFLSANRLSKAIKGKSRYIFSESGVEFESVDVTSSLEWSFYYEIQETNRDILMFTRKNYFVPIAKRFFQDQNQIQEFRELIKEKLGDKAKLKNLIANY